MVKKSAKKDTKEAKKAKKPAVKSLAAKAGVKKAVEKIARTEPVVKKKALQSKPVVKKDDAKSKEAELKIKAPKAVPAPDSKIEAKPDVKVEANVPPGPKIEAKTEISGKSETLQPEQAGPPISDKAAVIEAAVVEKAAVPQAEAPVAKVLEFDLPIPLKDFAIKLGIKPNEIILDLMSKNIFATINQSLGEELVIGLLKARGIDFRRPAKIE